MRRADIFLFPLLLAALTSGCKSEGETANPLTRVPQFSDVPIPSGFQLRKSQPENFILEAGMLFRSGQQTYVGGGRPIDAVTYFEERLPQHGWVLVSRTTSPDSAHLTYQKNDTTADFEIAPIPRSEELELRVVLHTKRDGAASAPATAETR